jgi:membrane protein DedA with SNARE-associated domain
VFGFALGHGQVKKQDVLWRVQSSGILVGCSTLRLRPSKARPRFSVEGTRNNSLTHWIERILETSGLVGLAFLMFLENVFPPLPSELIMPLAGVAAARGEADLLSVILAGTAGSLAGAVFWYGVGRIFDHERLKLFADRHGRWLTMTRRDLDRVDDWFDAHGHWMVLFGRLVPTIRTLISLPAGLSEMKFAKFAAYSSIGTALWTSMLTVSGYALGNHTSAQQWIEPLSMLILVAIVSIYIWRVVTFKPAVK